MLVAARRGNAQEASSAPAPVRRRRVSDAEVVAVLVKVILEEGTVSSQARLAALVNRHLHKRDVAVGGERLRMLAIKSGLVSLHVRTRVDGPTPELERCPVCRAKLRRTANRTLTGTTTQTGYKCQRCPWWTGRDLRIPMHYTFQARVARGEGKRRGQLSFVTNDRGE